LHFFGSGAREVTVEGMVFSQSNADSLREYAEGGTQVTLTSHRGSEGTFMIQNFSLKEFGPYVKLNLSGYDQEDVAIYRYQAKLIKV
jgi:hypothetical protein